MKLKQFLREWWVELALFALALVAAFLLLERMSIRAALWQGLTRLTTVLGEVLTRFLQAVVPGSLSDLIGLVLVATAIGLGVWRVRWRLRRSPTLTNRTCPRCGRSLMRVHRKPMDRAISKVLVPVHRYKCSGDQCNWQGLRVDTGQHHHSAPRASSSRSNPEHES